MSYYPTMDEDIARAKEILERGKVREEDMPVAMRDVLHVAGGTIYGVDTYAAYKLLESFVEEIEKLREQRAALHRELSYRDLQASGGLEGKGE